MGLLQRFSPICRAKRAVTALSLGCACLRNMTVRLVSKHYTHCATTSVKQITVHAAKGVRTQFSCREPEEDC